MNNTDKFDDTDFREVISDAEEPEKSEEPESGGKGELQESGEKENEYEDTCYICHRPESKAGKMIKIPNEICICADCMQKTFDSMSHVMQRERDNEKAKELATYYANMEAESAAQVMSEMDEDLDLICDILQNMSEKQAAAILQAMNTEYAAQITKKISTGR